MCAMQQNQKLSNSIQYPDNFLKTGPERFDWRLWCHIKFRKNNFTKRGEGEELSNLKRSIFFFFNGKRRIFCYSQMWRGLIRLSPIYTIIFREITAAMQSNFNPSIPLNPERLDIQYSTLQGNWIRSPPSTLIHAIALVLTLPSLQYLTFNYFTSSPKSNICW